MECKVAHSCQCSINCGLGFPSLFARLVKRKNKGRLVDASTQTDEGLSEIIAAKKWGERIHGNQQASRIAPPPPPPERKHGLHSGQPANDNKSKAGPFAPTVDELTKGRAALKKVNRTLVQSESVPPPAPPPPPITSLPKSVSLHDNNS